MAKWSITWESSGTAKKSTGSTTVCGERIMDALDTFFKDKANKKRNIVGIERVCIIKETNRKKKEHS